MIGAGTEVGHHDETPRPRLPGRVDHPDGGVAVDGVRARRVAAAGTRAEHHRVLSAEQFCQLVDRCGLDVGHHRSGTGGGHLVGVVGIAEHRGDLVAVGGEDPGQVQGHLAVASDDGDGRHNSPSSRSVVVATRGPGPEIPTHPFRVPREVLRTMQATN